MQEGMILTLHVRDKVCFEVPSSVMHFLTRLVDNEETYACKDRFQDVKDPTDKQLTSRGITCSVEVEVCYIFFDFFFFGKCKFV